MMAFNIGTNAFEDVKEIFLRALETPKGIKVKCHTRAEAINLRSRLNYYRQMDRNENKKVYPPDHPQHGGSVYDKLILRIPPRDSEDQDTIFIQQRSTIGLVIEDL